MPRIPVLVLAAALALPAPPRSLAAQSLSFHVGRMMNEDGDKAEPFSTWGLRADHAFTRWLLVEGGAQYVPVHLTDFGSVHGASGSRVFAPRFAFDAQLQLQLPLGRARPYVAVGRGVFTYRRLSESPTVPRPRLVGYSRLAALGIRVDLSRHLGARAALVVRGDRPSFGKFAIDVEPSAGMSVRW